MAGSSRSTQFNATGLGDAVKSRAEFWEVCHAVALEGFWIKYGQRYPRKVFFEIGKVVATDLMHDPGFRARYQVEIAKLRGARP